MKNKPILLTGASGFLGRNVFNQLSEQYEIATLGRSAGQQYIHDLTVGVPVLTVAYEMIVHAAGKAHTLPRTQRERDDFFKCNVEGTKNLLQALDRAPGLPKTFIFISSVAVYGRSTGEMITEEHPLLGDSPYARSKIQAEALLTSWCSERNITITILRIPLVVGVDPPGNLGAMIRMMKRGLYVGIGSGTARRSMVLAEDIGRFIPQVAKIGGVFNLTDGRHPAVAALENAILGSLHRGKAIRVSDNLLRIVARIGDRLGNVFPLNTQRFEKLVSTLTFSDEKATRIGWQPRSVIDNLPAF